MWEAVPQLFLFTILHRTQVRAIGRKFVMPDAVPLFVYTIHPSEKWDIFNKYFADI
jgi:hypothetical protein